MSYGFKSLAEVELDVYGKNKFDPEGNPAGGYFGFASGGTRIGQVEWQDGPVDRESGQSPNGVFVEDMLEICRIRLEFYQESRFSCPENEMAISHIKEAVKILTERHNKRKARGVLGKNEV